MRTLPAPEPRSPRSGQARTDLLGGYRDAGVSRVMLLERSAVSDDAALDRLIDDARAAGVELGAG